MPIGLPDREFAQTMGWTHQVDWIEQKRPCMKRCMSGASADEFADKLKHEGFDPVVTDLCDALQVH